MELDFNLLLVEDPLLRALTYGLVPAISTSIGGLLGLVGLRASEKWLDLGLSLSAGIMLGTSLYELLPESAEKAGFTTAMTGFTAGVLLIMLIERLIPHEHLYKGFEGVHVSKSRLKSVYLVTLAVIIHNIPEGMAVGASSYMSIQAGLATSASIALQDLPEGYAVSFPLSMLSRKKLKPILIAVLSGLSETIMAVLTALIAMMVTVEGFMLGMAAGSMLYVVSHEVIPETHRHGYELLATTGFIIGFIASLLITEVLLRA